MKRQGLPHPNNFHLSAAAGWLQLGNPAEAQKELDQIDPGLHHDADVLLVRWLIEEKMENWEAAKDTARQLFIADCGRSEIWILVAASLAEVDGPRAAFEFLQQAAPHFPLDSSIPYNLAVLASRCGEVEEARRWLNEACRVVGRIQSKTVAEKCSLLSELGERAANEPGLKPLWEEIMRSAWAV
ncbi:MAG: hypothetical protein AB1813_07255 [Verrucomicrobiota bacterium]|jgi:tetratricopeptide (TPR) repeat protein